MSQLPKNWKSTQLKNLLSFVLGGDWGKDSDYQDDDFETVFCIRGTEFKSWAKEKGITSVERKVKKTSAQKRALQLGDILIEISGGGPEQPVGRTVLIDEDTLRHNPDYPKICTNFIRLARPSNTIDSRYLNYYLRSFYASGEVVNYQGGSNNLRNLKFKEYETIEVPVAPRSEQKRIADKLDSVLAKVETAQARLDKIPTLLKRFRQSALASATSGELTKDWRLENDVNSWESTKVGNLLDNGPQNGIYKPSTFYGSGTKIIRIDGFYDGQLVDWNTIKRVNLEENELEKWKLKPDDILINRVNSIEYLGKCGHVKKLPEDAVFESNIMRISLKSDVLPEYLTYFLSSPIGLQRLRDNAKHAVNQASINQNDVKSVIFEKPSISEQKIIISKLSELLGHAIMIEKQYKAAKVRLDKLTQSILAKAFRGELLGTTVQQVESELKQSMIEPVLR